MVLAAGEKIHVIARRLFSLMDANLIFNVLPKDVVVEDVSYRMDDQKGRLMTDGKSFSMNVSEFGAKR